VFVPEKLFQPILKKRSSLVQKSIDYVRKNIYNIGPMTQYYKTFCPYFSNVCYKFVCFSLACFSSLV
jgi:hypothetical protein